MGAELDSLQVRITASSKQATNAIDKLSTSLEGISGALIPAASGLDRFADTLDRIVSYSDSISKTAKSLRSLSSASKSLSTFSQNGNPFTGVLTGLRELETVNIPSTLSNLSYIKETISKIGGDAGANAAASLTQIANGLRSFEGVTIPVFGENLTNLAVGLRSLGSGNMVVAAQALPYLAEGLRDLANVHIDSNFEAIANLANSISRFGYANIEKAIVNIPPLAHALSDLITTLSNAPSVNENTLRMINSLSNLQIKGTQSSKAIDGLSLSLKRYSGAAKKAKKASLSLAGVAGSIYANFFLVFRLFQQIHNAIKQAADLVEVQNVVDVTFGNMADKMNEFSKSAIDAIGMSELTAKTIGSRFQAMGAAMHISGSMIKQTNDFVQTATNGYADVANSMADMSINLTKLAGDMASFYNKDYEDVAKDLEAAYTGMTRPLRKYGLDLTQATLKEFALANGLDADISKMTQAEKTMLRYQYIMANTTAAHGDFQRTISTFSNQVRIAKERINQLAIVLGKIGMYTFKPLVISFNKAMEAIIKNATATLNALGKIFGWQIEWSDAGVLQDDEESANELADDMGEAADNAKKFKNFLLGIDELNLLPDKNDSGKGKGDDLGLGLGNLADDSGLKIKQIEGSFDSLYDTLYKLGRRIGEIIKDWLKNIDWDEVYKKARRFGKGLAQFLNGYLSDAELFYEKGRFIANAINTIAHAIDAFFHEFDGWQLGVDIGSEINGFTENLDWAVIRSAAYEMAHDIAQTINGAFTTIDWRMVGSTIANGLNTAIDFLYTIGDEINWSVIGSSFAKGINGLFSTFDFAKAGQTINKWAIGFFDMIIAALDTVDWKKIGIKIGEFLGSIDFLHIAGKIATALWKAINAAVSGWVGLLETAPLEGAIASAIILPFTNPLLGKAFVTAASKFFKKYGTKLSVDLGNLFNGTIFKTFGEGFKGYFANMDAVGMTGNSIGGIASGFNAVSKSISGVTKALGTATVGFMEFFTIQDAVSDIVKGTDNLVASIAEISVAAGAAGLALSAILGVPTGLIVAGATAGVAAIVGINKALDEIEDNNVMSVLTADLGDSYHSLEEIGSAFGGFVDNITGPIDKMNKQFENLQSSKKDLAELIGGFSIIGEAADNGTKLTSSALSELVGNIGEIKTAWEDYITAQYDYLIQSTVNNMNFIRSQRDLTDDEVEYFTKRINELSEAKYGDIKATTKAAQEAEDAWNAYFEALNADRFAEGVDISSKKLRELYDNAVKATDIMYGLSESTGVMDDFATKITGDAIAIESGIQKIDFSSLDVDNYAEFLASVQGYNDAYLEKYRNAMEEIETYKNNLKATGKYSDAELETETKAYFDTMESSAISYLDSVQLAMYDKLYTFIENGNYDEAYKYAREVIYPFVESFPDVVDREGKKIQPKIGDAVTRLLSDVYTTDHSYWSEVFGNTKPVLVDNWKELFDSIRNDIAPEAKKAGEETGKPFAEGMEKTLNGGIKTDGAKKNVDDLLKRLKSVDEGMKKVADSTDKMAEKTGSGTDRLGATAHAMVDLKDRTTLLNSGLINLEERFGKLKDSGKGVEEAATGFKSIDGSAKSLIATFTPLMTVFTQSSDVMGDALKTTDRQFKELYSDILNGGMKVASWFKSSFIPVFSTQLVSVIPKAFNAAFSQAFNLVKSQWNQFAKWSDENMKITVKGKNGDKDKDNVFKLKVGAYETGGFPEDGLFFANHTEMVGKFDNGKTAVANNEQITEGIEAAVYRAMSGVMERFNGSQNVNVEITGDASDIFRAVVKENDRMIMRTGASAIRV